MIGDIVVYYLLQIVFTVGIIALFGFAIAACNRRFYSNFGSRGMAVCYITGAVGTPIHEFAHALMCVLFGHKIVKIKLFQINSADGTLGYVQHTYNKKNLYHKIGNFFIGIAPIIVISAVLYLLASFLLPGFVEDIKGVASVKGVVNDIGGVLRGLFGVIADFFGYALSWQWWVFVILGTFLALHMTLSKPDIQGAISGLVFLLIAVLVMDIVLGVISRNLLLTVTGWILGASSYLLCILLLSLIISLIAVVISYVLRLIIR